MPCFVLKYTMNGQWWPDGGIEFHQWVNAATLLIHGAQDKLVLIQEEEEMLEVSNRTISENNLTSHGSATTLESSKSAKHSTRIFVHFRQY